ncbi:MAG: hypothetical protein QW639_03340 [Candidatus Bathyarchaeia archaeon]
MRLNPLGEAAYRIRLSESHLAAAEEVYRRKDHRGTNLIPALCRELGKGRHSILQNSELEP